ncbi:methyltransferase domain-containing protein [Patescibacteria group bacterium]|nr:MAG: methyltransferase domain-containing protein [Patescibacteria group bacterium]
MKLSTGCALLDPKAVLAEAGLSVGASYADFGAGTLGHFVFPASEMVGKDGRVWAVDILKGALAGVESRMKLEGMSNVTTVWGDIERLHGVSIPDAAADLLSIVNIASLIKKSPDVLKEVKRVLKRGGTFLVVDWDKAGASFGPPAARRLSAEELVPIVTSAGFVQHKSFRAGPHHWGLVFKAA